MPGASTKENSTSNDAEKPLSSRISWMATSAGASLASRPPHRSS